MVCTCGKRKEFVIHVAYRCKVVIKDNHLVIRLNSWVLCLVIPLPMCTLTQRALYHFLPACSSLSAFGSRHYFFHLSIHDVKWFDWAMIPSSDE